MVWDLQNAHIVPHASYGAIQASTGLVGSQSPGGCDTKEFLVEEQNIQLKTVPLQVPGRDEPVPAIFVKSTPIDAEKDPGVSTGTIIHPQGSVLGDGRSPLPVDVREDRDTPVVMSDGTTLLADIFRPVGDEPVPAILVWGPYGKRNGFFNYDVFGPLRMDVQRSWEDGLNKFEGPNPSYWVNQGYAVVNIDTRGAMHSEGDLYFQGETEIQDEYDTIEWIAEQSWSTGKVALVGNSWLAVSQWRIATRKPPHLTAIAPWEGCISNYRDLVAPGGIPQGPFLHFLDFSLRGNTWTESLLQNFLARPLYDEYWESKDHDLSSIEVPAYVAASWTNIVHSRGTLEAWGQISSEQKWLRVHNAHEWTDLMNPANVEDLRRFFDHFLKGVDNGWETTPTVRLSVLDPGRVDTVNRAESEFPLAREELVAFHLDASDGTLRDEPVAAENAVLYDPDEVGTTFRRTFADDGEITGFGKVKLWVSAEDADDLDVFVVVSLLDAEGNERQTEVVTDRYYPGFAGRLRASLRELDQERSTAAHPVHTFRTSEKLAPGEIVPLEIDLWPFSIRYHAGDTLQVRVNGVDLLKRPEAPQLPPVETLNSGRHRIHTGGKYDSHVLLPFVEGSFNSN